MSIAISHNMDNINPITQKDLAKYMGLTKDAAGNTLTDTSTAVSDASNSKYMAVNQPQNQTGHIQYAYRRGGVTLIADIDVGSQKITWTQSGLDTSNDTNRIEALAQGLKLAQTGDLGSGGTSPFPTTP